jgi:hypothetical protein
MTSPWYQDQEPPRDYVVDEYPAEPPLKRMSRLHTAALFVAVFLFGMLVGLPL